MTDLEKLIGQRVSLIGIARDAKGGAVLVTESGSVLYVKGLSSWSSELINKQVSISGLIKTEKIIPDPKISEDGGISAGAIGEQLVLENAKYSLSTQ